MPGARGGNADGANESTILEIFEEPARAVRPIPVSVDLIAVAEVPASRAPIHVSPAPKWQRLQESSMEPARLSPNWEIGS